jgi:transcription elongation GreA/GreB family factor
MHGKLSNTTPLGSALLEHRAGDTVAVNAVKSYKVKIEKIS